MFFPLPFFNTSFLRTRTMWRDSFSRKKCRKQKKLMKNRAVHSSEIRDLRSFKCSSKTLQNLLYFMYKKTHVVFFRFLFRATLYFYLMNALVYVSLEHFVVHRPLISEECYFLISQYSY